MKNVFVAALRTEQVTENLAERPVAQTLPVNPNSRELPKFFNKNQALA